MISGYEAAGVEQDADGVTLHVRDTETGEPRSFRGRYLIGADGAHSKVREALDIPLLGRGVFSNSVTIYLHADLAPLIGERNFSIIYINNPQMTGFFRLEKGSQLGFLVVSTVGDLSRPEANNAAVDVSHERVVELVRIAAGDPKLEVQIDGVARWRCTSDVAESYGKGRVFIAGDAAHLMPTNGGYGGNTGIHDGHNLAWKLAMVLKGQAGPELLATYETERRPVGYFTVEQAYTRYVTRSAQHLKADDFQEPVSDFDVELGYLYRSPAILTEPGSPEVHEHPWDSHGRPGSRATHLWLERDGKKISTLDLFGQGFVVLAGPDGGAWEAAVAKVAALRPDVSLQFHSIGGAGIHDPEGRFNEAYGLSSSGASLIRPDGFVAWRAEAASGDPAADLARALGVVLKS